MELDDSIEKTLSQIQKVMSANSVVGSPITIKEKTIIPISKTALGFGLGSGSNTGNNKTEVGGVGGGGSMDPIAFLIIYENIPGPDGIELLPVGDVNTPLEDILMGAGKFIFDFISNRNVSPATADSNQKTSDTIDNIKTKIKKQDKNNTKSTSKK